MAEVGNDDLGSTAVGTRPMPGGKPKSKTSAGGLLRVVGVGTGVGVGVGGGGGVKPGSAGWDAFRAIPGSATLGSIYITPPAALTVALLRSMLSEVATMRIAPLSV